MALRSRLQELARRAVRWADARGVRPRGCDWVEALEAHVDPPTGATPPLPHLLSFADRVRVADGIYRRETLAYEDVDSDAHMIRFHDRALDLLLVVWWRLQVRGAQEEPRARSPGAVSPVGVEECLAACEPFLRAIPPRIGEEHRWSAPALGYLRYGYWLRLWDSLAAGHKLPLPFTFSKLLLLLAGGTTARHAPTGRERRLHQRLMAHPDGAVTIPVLFGESYAVCEGDLYLTLLCAHNVLSEGHWRPDRREAPLQRKLARLKSGGPDDFSAWYHFFGTALYGLMRDRWKARLAARIESLCARGYRGADAEADLINLLGADFGAALRDRWRAMANETDSACLTRSEVAVTVKPIFAGGIL